MNIAGNLKEKIHHAYVRSVLSNHDIIGVCHTGSEQIEQMRTHKCILMPRTHAPTHGGVACLIKEWLVPFCRVTRKHPHLGILWIRVSLPQCAHTLYFAVCYFPPKDSSYYKDTQYTIRTHFDTLRQDIAEFASSGQIMLCGDFNARTGRSSDIADACDWSGMEDAGIAVPVVSAMDNLLQNLPTRYSTDYKSKDGKMGKPLLELCQDNQLVILNGRLPGDCDMMKGGACTFYARGRSGRSLIDYFIASPTLCFDQHGCALPGCSFRVLNPVVLQESSDHACVSCVIPLQHNTAVVCKPAQQHGCMHAQYRYRDEISDTYSAILAGDEFTARWDLITSGKLSMAEAVRVFDGAMTDVLDATHDACRPGIRVVQLNSRHGSRPRNAWYSDDCREKRDEWKAAVRQHGKNSLPARAACRAYHRVTRAARRRHQLQAATELASEWRRNPRSFWRSMKGAVQTCALNDVEVWATYFTKLLNANRQGSAYVSLEEHCRAHGLLYPVACEDDMQHAKVLNAEIEESEVQDVFEKCKCGKSAGVDGIPVEFFAHPILVPVLTYLFNCALEKKEYPCAWATAAITPILKSKGDPMVADDYRGIAVGAAMGRLFSLVMNARLDAWAEARGRRAQGQFGFRQGRGTVDAAFVLRHTVEMHRHAGKPLFCAFIDFKKAYDSIDRQLLWRCLEGMGVHGACLDMLKRMYDVAVMRVRVAGKISSPFTAEAGVKQGDPMSPILFGLFIDKVEQYFSAELGNEVGVRVADAMRRVLLYADDLVLMAESPCQLQDLLDCLSRFCKACCMTVNTVKSEIVCFNRQYAQQRLPRWMFDGQVLPVKSEFKYLGIVFDDSGEKGGVGTASARQLVSAKKALAAMWNRCYALRMHNVGTLCYLFDALVRPVASYGCEVWGPECIQHGMLGKGEHETMQYGFMRQALKVRASTPHMMLLAELGRQPISHFWVQQCVRFWNKVLDRPTHDLVRACLHENVALATEQTDSRCWAANMLSCLCNLGIISSYEDIWQHQEGQRTLCKIDCKLVETALQRRLLESWTSAERAGSPRSIGDNRHEGVKLATYHHWFRVPGGFNKKESYTRHLCQSRDIISVSHFRMGSHKLNVETQRWGSSRVARSQRICACCDMGVVEDEMHFLLECPLYHTSRKVLFTAFGMADEMPVSDDVMRIITNGRSVHQWQTLVQYIRDCNWKRAAVRMVA